jgi:hypothetical protein
MFMEKDQWEKLSKIKLFFDERSEIKNIVIRKNKRVLLALTIRSKLI